jgi:rSAM/selenodomain-associated transferase 1
VSAVADALLVFVKAPRPGAVKTRLAAEIGPDLAAALYRRIAELEIRGTAPLREEYEPLFFYAPADAGDEMRGWLGDVSLVAQEGADLGARMRAAFALAFTRGARRAAIIGTDVPWVRRAHVRDALDALDDHDLAIGPARDGGYYLLAMDRPRPALFEDVPWSTPDVLARTLDRAASLSLSVRTLEPQADLDTLDDVRREWPRLEPLLGAPLAAAVAAALRG